MKKILTCCRNPSEMPCNNTDIKAPVYIILENIRSLYNVGSVFRTSDAAKVQKLFLCGFTGYPPRKEISKTALGAQESVVWEYHTSALTPITQLKSHGVRILAVEQTTRQKTIWSNPLVFPVAFVFGYEIDGMETSTLDNCDDAVEIPMFGMKGSLNVSVACGIVVFEALRQYLASDKGIGLSSANGHGIAANRCFP